MQKACTFQIRVLRTREQSGQEEMWKQSFPSLFWWCQRLKSRIKIQEKTQDMQELQEKHWAKYQKFFSKEKIE